MKESRIKFPSIAADIFRLKKMKFDDKSEAPAWRH